MKPRVGGFTVVELLIVIVVIGILAALILYTFTGVQARARDAVRSDDMLAIKKMVLSYGTVNGGVLPRPPAYGEINAGGYDTSFAGDWLPFLQSVTTGTVPKDPVNNEAGDPTAANSKYTYFYYCYNPDIDSWAPNPPANTARFGYRTENTNELKFTDIDVDSCQ